MLIVLEAIPDSVYRRTCTYILFLPRQKINGMDIKLDSLDTFSRDLFQKMQQGHRTTQDLVSEEALETRTLIKNQADQSRAHASAQIKESRIHMALEVDRSQQLTASQIEGVRKQFSNTRLDDENSDRRRKLLQSLKFPGMNERRNLVRPSFPNTLRWVFKECDSPSLSGVCFLDQADEANSESDQDYETSSDSEQDVSVGALSPQWSCLCCWLRSDEKLYWVTGLPGSGKTTFIHFLLFRPKLEELINAWKPGAVIATHFFWRPGTALQKNIRGFLLSLIHQLLSNNASSLDILLRDRAGLCSKEYDSDWSETELQDILLKILNGHEIPLFLILDGIDEIYEEHELVRFLDLLDDMMKIPHLKILLASRPEPPIQDRYWSHPRLRLQDLNSEDLRQYAMGRLRFPQTSVLGLEEHIVVVEALLKRAQGVFLWLVLAVNSVNAGLQRQDSLWDVMRRIKSLPVGLINLYKEMWSRLQIEHPIYCKRTAAHIKMLSFAKRVLRGSRRYYTVCDISPVPILVMAVITYPSLYSEVCWEDTRASVQFDRLLGACREMEQDVNSRSAGFLQVIYKESESLTARYKQFQKHLDARVVFTHRSAYDFIADTQEGRAIESLANISQEEMLERWIHGCILKSQFSKEDSSSHSFGLLLLIGAVSKEFRDLKTYWSKDGQRLVLNVRKLHRFGKARADVDGLRNDNHFLWMLIHRSLDMCLTGILRRTRGISEAPHPHILWTAVAKVKDDSRLEAIHELLLSGTSPNHSCFVNCFNTSFEVGVEDYHRSETTLGQFLKNLLLKSLYGHINDLSPSKILGVLNQFLIRGVDLEKNIYLVVQPRKLGSALTAQILLTGASYVEGWVCIFSVGIANLFRLVAWHFKSMQEISGKQDASNDRVNEFLNQPPEPYWPQGYTLQEAGHDECSKQRALSDGQAQTISALALIHMLAPSEESKQMLEEYCWYLQKEFPPNEQLEGSQVSQDLGLNRDFIGQDPCFRDLRFRSASYLDRIACAQNICLCPNGHH